MAKDLGSKVKVIQAEIRYQKVVLGHKSSLLKLTGNLTSLVKNFKKFLNSLERRRERRRLASLIPSLGNENAHD